MYTCAVPSTLGLILVRGESKAKKKKKETGGRQLSNNKVGLKHLGLKHYSYSEPNFVICPTESK